MQAGLRRCHRARADFKGSRTRDHRILRVGREIRALRRAVVADGFAFQAGKKQLVQPTLSALGVNAEGKLVKAYLEPEEFTIAADPVVQYMNAEELKKQIAKIKTQMVRAAKEMDFVEAARLRDEMYALEKLLNEKITKNDS